jgi:serine/threonine-protein kinase HipA
MVSAAFIKVWNRRVGAVVWQPDQGTATFQYDPDFVSEGLELAPFTMPLEQGDRIFRFPELKRSPTFRGLPGLLADVLPDKYGNALINAWLAGRGRPADSLNPVEMLCFIGNRGVGALEFEPERPRHSTVASKLEVGALVDMAEKILTRKKKFRSRLPAEQKTMMDILKIGSSAGGARAKALVAYNPETQEVRSGQAEAPGGFSHWIIKFDGVSDSQFGATHGYGRVEMAYHLMCRDAGIDMTECRLFEENGRAHFLTRRFDRTSEGKVHTQSFCSMRHFDFNDVTLYSYEQLFETMRLLALPYPQVREMFRRMVFNVMSRNCDDHTKNFSFLMDHSGTWKLSPAYDMCHAYRPGSDWVSQHGLSINGKRKAINRDDLLAVAAKINIKKPEQVIDQVADVIKRWPAYARQVKVDARLREAIGKTHLII